jgi:preprotein translocase subunit SecA
MERKPRLAARARYALGRAKGIPIEVDLGPYLAVARAARAIGTNALSDAGIIAKAREARGPAAGRGAEAEDALVLALAAEAARRALGLDPYEEQLVAATALSRGKVAQMATGEGKTLAAALAATLAPRGGAAAGGGFHVLTANDYLARRDAEWMRPLYSGLGLSVAWIGERSTREERRAAYLADVTYLSARELGFDYLRDGLARDASELVQPPFSRALVDEADFILIDEARVPLVIAGADEGDGVDVRAMDRVAAALEPGLDYRVDAEGRSVAVTGSGYARAALLLGPRDGSAGPIGSERPSEDLPESAKARLFAALHARRLLRRDVDYVVKDGAARLVDSFTGRVAERRQWPWGIQAALEAKEGLEIGPEGRIFGSITAQHLMGLYPFMAAMTATAESAAEEFARVYGMGTVVVPPARPSARIDLPDAVFWSKAAKAGAVADEIARAHESGRPVLVGTGSVLESEELAAALAEAGVGCVVLNARNDGEEASLVARAGELGAVTISTNMAGRGTDIKLGEDPRIRELGGLYVIGTSRHESRRVDDQLRGRAGRQGDPGTTRFFLSLEDELFERYGVRGFLPEPYRSGVPPAGEEPREIADQACGREIRRAQAIIEGQNSTIRRLLIKRSLIVEYDRRYARALRDAALGERRFPEAVEEALAAAGPERDARVRPVLTHSFISRLDAAWADHLATVEDVKEGIGLQLYGGKDPHREYLAIVSEEFERAMRELECDALADCAEILREDTRGGDTRGVDSPAAPRRGAPPRPASTWTYAVDAEKAPAFDLGSLSGIAGAVLGPLALPAFLAQGVAKAFARRREKPRSEN